MTTFPPIPHETSMPAIDGRKTQLAVGGSGPPLVYLHSASGETEWMPFHDGLAASFRLYLPAHPGFALSEGLDQIRDIADLAWHYVDFLEHLQLKQIDIVGFSLGAWIGLELAILRPSLVRRMVFVAAAGLHLKDAPIAEIFGDNMDALRRKLFFDPEGPHVGLAMPSSLDDPRILLWLRAREATARVAWNPYLHNPKLPRHLRRIACPVKLLWGRQDAIIPLAHGEYYAQHLPNAKLEAIDKCGHMLPFEKPAEFVACTRSFLKD
ncbi:MAG: alpha/beta hydrolase [Planctomycetia bacterium]|nr:alpha/beta hydrolase [Planctomycetia bacterium]